MLNSHKVLALVSGGMDSITMAYQLKKEGHTQSILFFEHEPFQARELQYALLCAERLDVPFMSIPLGAVFRHIKPQGDVIPNRNAIFLSVAFGIAASNGFTAVATGVHSSDAAFLDCSPSFIYAFETMEHTSLGLEKVPILYTPYLHFPKARIVMEGARLEVPYEDTWSCYKEGELHCGTCSACTNRKKAFHLAGVPDPAHYL